MDSIRFISRFVRPFTFHYRSDIAESRSEIFHKKYFWIKYVAICSALFTAIPMSIVSFRLVQAIANMRLLFYGNFFIDLVDLVWSLQTSVSYLFMVYIFHSGKFDLLVLQLEQSSSQMEYLSTKKQMIYMCCCALTYTLFTTVVNALSAGGILVQGFTDDVYGTGNMIIFAPFVSGWGALSWSLALAVYYLISQVIQMLAKNFLESLKSGAFRISEISQRHVQIIELVEMADSMLKGYGGLMLCMSVVLAVLQLYAILLGHGIETNTKIQLLCWLLAQLWYIVMISSVAQINKVASQFAQTFYVRFVKERKKQEFSDPNRFDALDVAIIMHQLSSMDVGFTFWDLFVINQSTMSTMFSLVMTYFILLIQFFNPNVVQAVNEGVNKTILS